MIETTVQFDCHIVDLEFTSNGRKLPFKTNQLRTVENKLLLQQQQANGVLLESIKHKVDQIHEYLRNCEEDIQIATSRFAESFTRLIFQHEPELVLEKIKAQLVQIQTQIDPNVAIRIYVHPGSVQALSDCWQDESANDFEILADPLLEIGDCRVEGPDSGWIARMENQLDVCRQSLFAELDGKS